MRAPAKQRSERYAPADKCPPAHILIFPPSYPTRRIPDTASLRRVRRIFGREKRQGLAGIKRRAFGREKAVGLGVDKTGCPRQGKASGLGWRDWQIFGGGEARGGCRDARGRGVGKNRGDLCKAAQFPLTSAEKSVNMDSDVRDEDGSPPSPWRTRQKIP